MTKRLVSTVWVLGAGLWCPGAEAAQDPFEITEIESNGRTVAAEFADLDGDARTDVIQWVIEGYPPDETRWIQVYRQGASGEVPTVPSARWRLPRGVAAYDLADLLPEPGVEVVLLRAEGLQLLSLRGDTLDSRDLPIVGAPTLGLGTDERGLDRLSIVRREVNGDPWLWIPFPGWAVAVSPDGAPLARLQVGIRANYLIPPPGPRLFESGIQTYLDSPRLEFGDVDGDGRTDVIASARYELRVFLQREDGSFGESPDRVQPLRRISESDHLRGSGAVRVQVADANGDDRADVIVSYLSGGLTDIRTRTTLHLNRGGVFDLDVADHAFETDDSWVSDWLIDTDGDARPEWVRAKVSLSLFELIEVLLTRSLDAELEVYRQDSESGFEREPFERRKLSLPYSFDTYRPRGFIPTLEEDLNGDGQLDLLASGAGGKLEVFLGGPTKRLRRRDATQELDTRGRIRFGDLNGDPLPDFLIFDPRRPDASLRIARNTGSLASGGVPSAD